MNIFKTVLLAGLVSLPLVSFSGVAARAADADPYVPSEVAATSGFYLRGDAGASFLNWSGGTDDTSWVAGGGFGYRFNDYFRADLTGDWSGNYSIAPGAKLDTAIVLGNVYFDWKNDSMFTPYVGAGIGYGWASGAGFNDSEGIAAGLAAGVSVDMTTNLALDVGYRFRDIMISGDDPMEHQVTAGIRFKF
jgi:opacity protein-like surface antigen